jgi:hypothetical protein
MNGFSGYHVRYFIGAGVATFNIVHFCSADLAAEGVHENVAVVVSAKGLAA